jgi:hypothetical protein
MFHRIALLSLVACLVACGGGEDYEDPTEQAFEMPSEPPSRGVEWLAVTAQVEAGVVSFSIQD